MDGTLLWRREQAQARLNTPLLNGEVCLTDPAAGVGRLAWQQRELPGFVLGFTTAGIAAGTPIEPQDAFTRGGDLVAVYKEPADESFSWQVYWRAIVHPELVVLDTILSLQTPLLESFPRVTTCTRLPAEQVWAVPIDGPPQPIDDLAPEPASAAGILLRPATADWSYAEITHPDDQGSCQLSASADGQIEVQRHLGGQFLEKGVIRRLRLRGVFLPRENDLQLAVGSFAELASESPPLTA